MVSFGERLQLSSFAEPFADRIKTQLGGRCDPFQTVKVRLVIESTRGGLAGKYLIENCARQSGLLASCLRNVLFMNMQLLLIDMMVKAKRLKNIADYVRSLLFPIDFVEYRSSRHSSYVTSRLLNDAQ